MACWHMHVYVMGKHRTVRYMVVVKSAKMAVLLLRRPAIVIPADPSASYIVCAPSIEDKFHQG